MEELYSLSDAASTFLGGLVFVEGGLPDCEGLGEYGFAVEGALGLGEGFAIVGGAVEGKLGLEPGVVGELGVLCDGGEIGAGLVVGPPSRPCGLLLE